MRSVLVILMLWLGTTAFVQSQDTLNTKVRYLSISGGTGHVSLRNESLTPLIYRGSGFVWDVRVSNHSSKRKHDAVFNYGTSVLSSKLNDASRNSLDNATFFFAYDYQRNLKTGRFNWYLGGGFDYLDSERNLGILNRSHSSRNEFLSIRLVTSINRTFKHKHHLELRISYALASLVTGLTKIPNGLQESEHRLFNGFESVGLSSTLNYKYNLSNRLLLDISYRFRYNVNTEIEALDYGTSQYLLGMSYQFSK